ncbi:hypothetical protein EFE11_12170 [Corynebacterium diphtheriae]|nr:hypothetical protein EFE11_12170 [Corynebacterium diphtheriae]
MPLSIDSLPDRKARSQFQGNSVDLISLAAGIKPQNATGNVLAILSHLCGLPPEAGLQDERGINRCVVVRQENLVGVKASPAFSSSKASTFQ